MALMISSSVFQDGSEIPVRYTAEGEDIAPPLAFSGVPSGTKSLVLIVDDPDAPDPAAPKKTFVHWVVYNIAADATDLSQGTAGVNDWGKAEYGGPNPPIGRHRYFFKLFALDTMLDPPAPATKANVERAMKDHILERAQLIGTYQKHARAKKSA